VVEPAGVAQGELAVGIDAVAAEKAALEDRWLAVAETSPLPDRRRTVTPAAAPAK
jgi:hypothetical protein